MIASAGRLFAAVALGGALFAVMLVFVLVGTTAGTRFLAARAQPYLPPEFSFATVDGTLLNSVRVEGLRWGDDNVEVSVRSITVDVALRPLLRRNVHLESVKASDVVVRVIRDERPRAATGTDTPLTVNLPVTLVVDDLHVTSLLVESGDLRQSIDTVAMTAAVAGSALTVERLAIVAPWLGLQISGEGTLAPPYDFNAGLDWAQTAWSSEAPLVRSDGRLEIGGTLDAYRIKVRTVGEAVAVGDVSLWAEGEGNASEVRVLQARIKSGSARADIDGEIVIQAEGGRWNTKASVAGIELARLRPDVDGTIALDASVSGEMPDWRAPRTSIAIDAVTGTLFGKSLSGGGTVVLDEYSVSFSDVVIGTGDNDIGIDGQIAEKIGLNLRVNATDLGAILPEIAGGLAGELRVSGTPEVPRVGGQLDGVNIGIYDLRAEALQIKGAGDSRGKLRIDMRADGISRGDQRFETVTASLAGTLAKHEVAVNSVHRGNSATLALTGGYGDGLWAGQLTRADATFAGSERWSLVSPALIETSAEGQSITGLCLSGGADRRICAEFGAVTADQEWHLNVGVASLPLAPFVESQLPRLQASGRIGANLVLEFRDNNFQGTFDAHLEDTVLSYREADADAVRESEFSAFDPVPVSLSLSGMLDNNRLSASGKFGFGDSGDGNFTADVDDVVSGDSAMQATADFALSDLSFASLFVPGADVRNGELSGEVSVAGSVKAPTVGGALRLRGADVAVFAAGAMYEDVEFQLVPGKAGEFNFEGGATGGAGRVEIRGVTAIDAEAGWPTRLAVQGQNIDFIRLPDWTVVASPDLNVELTTESASVSGTVTVPSALIKLDQLPETAESPSPDTTVHRRGDESRRDGMGYDLDIAVIIEKGVRLQGFGLDTALTGKLEIDGTDATALRGVGELNLVDGRFEAYGQELEIERGRLNFTGSLSNPLLDFRATRQVDELMVGIAMGGSVEQPQSSVFSDPAMSEASALALLVTGRPLESAGESDGNLVAGAAIALGLKRAGNIGAEIGATLGLDDFSIEGGSTDGRVLAGKRVSKNLYLRYAFGIFDNIGSLLLRYRLSERLTFESESGEEQSLDLIYSVDRQ